MSGTTRRALLGGVGLCVLPTGQAAAWAQATPVPAPDVAPGEVPVSVLIQNSGMAQDRLTGATSPISRGVTLHTTHLDHGQRVMRQLGEIAIPARSVISLEPGAMHLMLNGLRENLVQGQAFPLTLHFAEAGDVPVDVRVRRKQDAAGVAPIPPVVAGPLTILHASAPPASILRG